MKKKSLNPMSELSEEKIKLLERKAVLTASKNRLNELRARRRHLSSLVESVSNNNKPLPKGPWVRSVKKPDELPWKPWEGWSFVPLRKPMHKNTREFSNAIETKLSDISPELNERENTYKAVEKELETIDKRCSFIDAKLKELRGDV